MPELPEVETILRGIAPAVTGRVITAAHYYSPLAAAHAPQLHSHALQGRLIQTVRRHGKYLLFELDRGWLTIHLRMTGKLLLDAHRTAWTRAALDLDDGHALLFDDPRQFGRVLYSAAYPEDAARLGPDALDIALDGFLHCLAGRRGRIKPLLLNQRVLAGLGNIYVDESLHRAGIHPLAELAHLGKRRLARLHAAIAAVLGEAVEAGGSSISDYVDAEGRRGWFQTSHRVYGRSGEPCLGCGTPIERIEVGQRGTHFCPHCQRR
jgi:formamidopyrimidine-DNA glycosylase